MAGLHGAREPQVTSPFWNFGLLPAKFRPPFAVTNHAMLGYAFDATTSFEDRALIRVRSGSLTPSGEPRDWQNGEVSPIERVAQTFGDSPVNAVEWFFPQRLSIDVDAAHDLNRN